MIKLLNVAFKNDLDLFIELLIADFCTDVIF